MGIPYHRGQNQAIPAQPDYRPIIRPGPPQEHYSTRTGEWDGQLPHADIADQSNGPDQHQSPNWPTLLERMLWTRAIIRAHQLTPPQAAVLNEICFRDGRGLGCTATMATLALDTGYNEKSIRRATQALEQHKIIVAQGNPGQKKFLGLPVKNGQLPWPTPDRESGDSAQEQPEPRTESPGFVQQGQPLPRTESPGLTPTLDRKSGVNLNPGQRVRATPDTESDITLMKHNRERDIYISSSLSPDSFSGCPDRESGVPPASNSDPPPEAPEAQPASVKESEVAEDHPKPETERIRPLVLQNWPLLEKNGWQFLEAAVKHYNTYGITYLQHDLRIKRENLERAEMATRTCAHCGTVHASTDQLRECVMCHEPKCISEMSPCHRAGCDGTPPSRKRAGPQSRQRR